METQTKNLLIYLILPLFLLTTVILIADYQIKPDFRLRAHFFDNFTLVRTYTGQKVIIDGGPDDKILSQVGSDLPFFDHTIDLLILTKVDSAHVTGLVDILKRYKVKMVLIPPSDANLAAYWEFLDLVEQNHVKKVFLNAGQRLWLDNATVFDVLAVDPFSAKLTFGKTQFLFPDTQDHNVELVSDGSQLVKK